jgi:hypothetical protein
MARLTTPEFNDAVTALAEHYGVERLRDKLATIGAFQSRKGLTSASAIADRLHRLSGGLRLPVAATYAFSHVWGQMLSDKLGGEENEKTIEGLAEKVNACLDEKENIVPGGIDLDAALIYCETRRSRSARRSRTTTCCSVGAMVADRSARRRPKGDA